MESVVNWTQEVTEPGIYETRWKSYGSEGRVYLGKIDWYDRKTKKNLHFLPFGMKLKTMRLWWEFRRVGDITK
jgi:hypothetical protein